jgi:hypothetical protein
MTDPFDTIEALNSLRNMAELARGLFDGLLVQGFTEDQALHLTNTWLAEMIRGARGQ